jgi:ATP-dependent Clp protease ATP-binding subunit ClpX
MGTNDRTMYCSFCRRSQHHVDKLVSGPGVLICDRCQALAGKAMSGEAVPDFPGWEALDDEQLLDSLVAADDAVRRTQDAVGDVVRELRAREVSWARVGERLGVSRQAAWERFAPMA